MTDLEGIDRSVSAFNQPISQGSDVAAEMLRRLGIEYIALDPGAGFRGSHDSRAIIQATATRSRRFASTGIMRSRSPTTMRR